MAETEQLIEIRSLCGASTTVHISPHLSIRELKLLLKKSFPPASTSPNFHLFLKGAKLSLNSQISSHSIGSGEFIAMIPFIKKDHHQAHYSNASNFADVAWSDIIQDLSSLKSVSESENQDKVELNASSIKNNDMVQEVPVVSDSSVPMRKKGVKRDRQECQPDSIIVSILQFYSENDIVEEKNCEKFVEMLELIDCVSDPNSGSCMLRESILEGNGSETGGNDSKLCVCPSWLKAVLKSFSFLNIFAASCQIQQKEITRSCLEEALNQVKDYGLQIGMVDLEHLSVLCPKIVCFLNEFEATKMSGSLIIIQQKTQAEYIAGNEARKQISMSKIVNIVKKRDSSFRKNLWEIINSARFKNGNHRPSSFSRKEFMHAKEGGTAKIRSCSMSPHPPMRKRCHETNQLLPMEMVQHLRNSLGTEGQVVHIEEIGARTANYVEVPNELSHHTRIVLKRMGISKLYSHQADSVQASLAGKNVIVATMTSSGKSLCYNLPVLEVLSQNMSSCAIYLFPTKALAQDQLRALLAMTEGFYTSLDIGVYDGDTSMEDRVRLRDKARLLITNPDMLHLSILPFHEQFSRILSNLRYVIIDEAHSYKGAFGCHTSLILRRLRRLCSHVYGCDPNFILCSATSGNPREHAMELIGLSTLELIQNDGSPSSSKLFVLWNPALCLKTVPKRAQNEVNASKSVEKVVVLKRSSPLLDLSCIFAEIVQHGLRCIAFCKSRKLCELVLCYTREILQETAPHLVDSVCAYRAGYIAQDRRRIENEFFGGKLRGIAATNALELGIDVGHIDVTLHLGFPGSIASLWQQAGRSGRRERSSLAVYVAFDGPLDQYFMKYPQKLFRSPIECCHIDSQNRQVLEQHLLCSACEHPLHFFYDEKYFGSGLENSILSLKNRRLLGRSQSDDPSARIWSYIGHEKRPSVAISIRAIESERYKVIDKLKNEVLEEIEESKAFFQVYEGAVYIHQGKTYLVKELDIPSKIAYCQQADLKYYTKTRDYTDIHVIGSEIAYPARVWDHGLKTTAQAHSCSVTTSWLGFCRIWKRTNQVFDKVELSLPSYSYQSQAVWVRVSQSIKKAVEAKDLSFRGGLHGASHSLLHVVPLYVICNSSDLASECFNPHDTRYIPERILIYDQHPGGSGVAAQVQPRFTELLTAALELLTSCSCSGDTGCPNCIQSVACHEYNEVLHKDAAIMIIQGVLDEEKMQFGVD